MIKHRIKAWAVGKWSFRAIQLIWQKTWVEILAKNVWVQSLAENVWVQSLAENVWVEIYMARQIIFPDDGFLDESITDYQYHKPYKHQCIHHTMFANTTKLQYVFVSWTLRSLAKNRTLEMDFGYPTGTGKCPQFLLTLQYANINNQYIYEHTVIWTNRFTHF